MGARKTPVVMLDVDGCLITAVCPTATASPRCVRHLNWIAAMTGAEIVVSSTWRFRRDCDERLKRWGVKARIIGQTPDLSRSKVIAGVTTIWMGATRGQEIAAWLDAHGPRPFVILDDDADMGALAAQHVRTTWRYGLTRELAVQAITILRSQA